MSDRVTRSKSRATSGLPSQPAVAGPVRVEKKPAKPRATPKAGAAPKAKAKAKPKTKSKKPKKEPKAEKEEENEVASPEPEEHATIHEDIASQVEASAKPKSEKPKEKPKARKENKNEVGLPEPEEHVAIHEDVTPQAARSPSPVRSEPALARSPPQGSLKSPQAAAIHEDVASQAASSPSPFRFERAPARLPLKGNLKNPRAAASARRKGKGRVKNVAFAPMSPPDVGSEDIEERAAKSAAFKLKRSNRKLRRNQIIAKALRKTGKIPQTSRSEPVATEVSGASSGTAGPSTPDSDNSDSDSPVNSDLDRTPDEIVESAIGSYGYQRFLAIGQDMSETWMKQIFGRAAKPVGLARLDGYSWAVGESNMPGVKLAAKQSCVYGVLWEVRRSVIDYMQEERGKVIVEVVRLATDVPGMGAAGLEEVERVRGVCVFGAGAGKGGVLPAGAHLPMNKAILEAMFLGMPLDYIGSALRPFVPRPRTPQESGYW